MNETIKTGTVTGTFADVLNWAGTSEDDFNAKLQAANSETERANIVLQELASQGLINAGQAWQENNKSLVESNQANAELSDSLARLSEEVMPIITKITDAISKLINFILDNKDAVMTALVAIGAGFAAFKITGIVTSLFSGFQKLFSAIKTGTPIMQALNTTMSANPIGLIISAIAALVSAFIYLWNNCEAFRQFWITLWENIKQVFTNVWNAIVGFFTETIPNAWQTVVDMFNAAVDWWNGLWQGVGDFFKGIWDGICSFFTQTIPNAWNQVKSMFDRVGQWWNNLWQGVSNTFKRIWDGFVDIAKAPINGIIWLINKAIDGINWIIDGINSIGFDVPDWLGGGHVGFQIGKINNLPYLAKGGTLSSGSAIVGEKGPELLTMLDGGKARVTPLTNSQKQQGSFLTGGITINIDSFTNNDTTKDVKQLTAYIMDEINMAKSEAMAVLHATLDFRRTIDVPGYERIELHPATRFIATMNYGYSGTKELNEALVSRFAVIQMPMIATESLIKLIRKNSPAIREDAAEELAALFLDLQKKCENAEISSKALDLRGLLGAINLMEKGLDIHTALDMGIANKSFDPYEQTLIRDTIQARISRKIQRKDVFRKKS